MMRHPRPGRLFAVAGLAATAMLILAAPSQAKPLLSTTVTAPDAVERSCFAREVAAGPGVVKRSVTSPGYGLIMARLRAASGDWDLGVFNARTGRQVAGSAHFGAREVAEAPVKKGERLVVQACHRNGGARVARLTVEFVALDPHGGEGIEIVRVSTPTDAARQKLLSLGLEPGEHPGFAFTDLHVRDAKDLAKLGNAGLISVSLGDVAARYRKDLLTLATRAGTGAITGLPSGRTGPYRRLADYTSEMNALAAANPTFVKKLTLPLASLEGRPVEGLEITTDVNARDGKPVFAIMGLHHAREWPSAEHTLEWAYQLVCGFAPDPPGAPDLPCPDSPAAPDARVVNLLNTTRTIIIPIVNVDGFNISREVGEAATHGGGFEGDPLTVPNEFRRKNCRVNSDPPSPAVGSCAGPAFGVGSTGVDPNRNYGAFWGGPGSSASLESEIYHGPHCPTEAGGAVKGPACGPFSEPDTENIRRLVSTRHITTLITNHTYTGLVLRAPGLSSQGLAPDEPAMKALGDAMAVENGYISQYGWQLYDTTGTTEDWSYNTTGGYGYTFEIGNSDFHPLYAKMISEYDGTATWPNPDPEDGNREAYFLAQENTANPVHHSRLTGTGAPPGAVLRLKKVVQTPTSVRNADLTLKTFTDTLDTTMVAPASGVIDWHVNPSTRPLVMEDRGRPGNCMTPPCSASPAVTFSGTVAGPPADGAAPCANFDTPPPSCTNLHPFTVPTGPSIDNAKAAVQMSWLGPGSDWDMKVFRDTNGDGDVDPGEPLVGSSGQSTTASEATSVVEPTLVPGAKYVVQVINWAAAEPYSGSITFYGPEPFVPAQKEKWTFTCEVPEGTVKGVQLVQVDRGQTANLGSLATFCVNGPTSVDLRGFDATATPGRVTVTWRTAAETAAAGFNVWRVRNGRATKMNRVLIPAKRAGTAYGASYRFVDRAPWAGATYTYRLQVVGQNGARAWKASKTVRITR